MFKFFWGGGGLEGEEFVGKVSFGDVRIVSLCVGEGGDVISDVVYVGSVRSMGAKGVSNIRRAAEVGCWGRSTEYVMIFFRFDLVLRMMVLEDG